MAPSRAIRALTPREAEAARHRRHAKIVRLVAYASAVILVARAAIDWQEPGGAALEARIRLLQAAAAALIGVLAVPGRSAATRTRLALALLLDIAAGNWLFLALGTSSVWEPGAVLIGLLLAAVFLVVWSWEWQAALAGAVFAGAALALFLGPGAAEASQEAVQYLAVLGIVGLASVLGVWLVHADRMRLAGSEARYWSLFNEAAEAILILDSSGRVTEANASFASLVERPVEELLGSPAVQYLAQIQPNGLTAQEVFDKYFGLALAGEHGVTAGYALRADRTELAVEMAYSRVATPQGTAVQVVLRDLSAHRALERRQAREQRLDAMARLAGGISHQFNNLLAAVHNNAWWLKAEIAGPEQEAALDEIMEASRRGRDLAGELLRFARYEEIVLRPIDAAEVVKRVAELARATVVHGVKVVEEVPAALPQLAGDTDELAHACLQLVLNARDAMPEGGVLTLSARELPVGPGDADWPGAAPGRYVCLSVRDTGRGMDAATRDRAFEPFSSARPMWEARGVGLPAVYGVVRAHRGVVRIESAPGRGTTVHLLIPVWQAPVAPARPSPAQGAPARATVLIVDDQEIVRHSVRRALTRLGYNVLEAGDGDVASAELAAAQPPVDLMILDLVMPGGGQNAFREIKKSRPKLPILISSGYAEHGDGTISALLAAGAVGFLRKPYEVDDLRHAVARALGEVDD